MCHLILLLPLFGLPLFWIWPFELALPSYLAVLLLSGWVYWYAIAAMRRQVVIGPETLLHSQGEVVSRVADGLRIRVQSELWGADGDEALKPGDAVEVVGIEGLRLRVKRLGQRGTGDSVKHLTRGTCHDSRAHMRSRP